MTTVPNRPLSIFVHRASECLTDYESHGDGLICFSLLIGLGERGHQVYAFTNPSPIQRCSPNLHLYTGKHRVPANSLAPWEFSWQAECWMQQLQRSTPIDLVWRMHPYGEGCPYPPRTFGKPLVIGPLFSEWPADFSQPQNTGMPRFGISLKKFVWPYATRGWRRALQSASLMICATEARTASLEREVLNTPMLTSPVIVESPYYNEPPARKEPLGSRPLRLLLAANLVPNKNVDVFCETVKQLNEAGLQTEGIILGEGPGHNQIEEYIKENQLEDVLSLKGKRPHSEVWKHLRDSDILISCSGFEAYGRTIVEAMSVGTPAVCYGGSIGPTEIISHGIDGLLVSELTAEAYASQILNCVKDPHSLENLAANALIKAENWRSNVVLDRLEESLLNTVSQDRRRQA